MLFLLALIQTIASSTCALARVTTQMNQKNFIKRSYFNNFPGESDILAPLFEQFRSAIKLSDTNNPVHFTRSEHKHSAGRRDKPA